MGNIVTRNEVHRFSLKEKGVSTLGGRQVWFDPDVLRLNYEDRGEYLGEFGGNDLVLVVLRNGSYYTSTFDDSNHYEDNILRIEKYRPNHVWTAVLYDADQGYRYIKRFTFEPTTRVQRFIGDNPKSELILLSDEPGARFEVRFGGDDSFREPMVIDAAEFIGVKSFKAKGKRISNLNIDSITEIEPRQMPEEELPQEPVAGEDIPDEPTNDEPDLSDDELRDEINGQERLF